MRERERESQKENERNILILSTLWLKYMNVALFHSIFNTSYTHLKSAKKQLPEHSDPAIFDQIQFFHWNIQQLSYVKEGHNSQLVYTVNRG